MTLLFLDYFSILTSASFIRSVDSVLSLFWPRVVKLDISAFTFPLAKRAGARRKNTDISFTFYAIVSLPNTWFGKFF